jgi:CO dehydrogenase maturation factor
MMVGKILDPFQGCACTMADITRELTGKISVTNKEVILVDMEAGVESFGRGVERNMDTILIVVEPSFESMALADKINYMAKGMGIARVKAILNKVPSEKIRDRMIEELSAKKIETIGTVFYDVELNEAGFEGSIIEDSTAIKDIQKIVDLLLQETKQLTV